MEKFIKKEKLGNKNGTFKKINYYYLTRLFFILSIILVFWVFIVAFGSSVGMRYNWALFDIEMWTFIVIGILILLIVIDVIFLVLITKKKDGQIRAFQESMEENIDGKKIIVFTIPINAKGGIFSKTYVTIDDTSILRLRELMVPPEDLWD